MSALNPRAIAVQGIGFSQRLVSMQGLWPQGTTIISSGPARRVPLPSPLPAADDDLLLILAATMIAASAVH